MAMVTVIPIRLMEMGAGRFGNEEWDKIINGLGENEKRGVCHNAKVMGMEWRWRWGWEWGLRWGSGSGWR